jgi:CRISPR-associated exonuclease Cas4
MKESTPHYTGTQMNYYFVCHRKLWLFSRGIQMEQESDVVFQGKLLSEDSYERRRKEIDIAGTIVLDSFDSQRGIVYEVKKSRSVEKAHIWQVKYYLYFLKTLGVQAKGQIDYPLLRRTEQLELGVQDENELKRILTEIDRITRQQTAPPLKTKSFCRKCAYYEFCWE